MFWQNEEYASDLGNDVYLDGVVCVVDAVFGEQVCSSLFCSEDVFSSDDLSKWTRTKHLLKKALVFGEQRILDCQHFNNCF